MLAVCLLLLQAAACLAADDSPDGQPLWRSLFQLRKDWIGFYNHHGNNDICSVKVLSADYVHFTWQTSGIDMKVSSYDSKTVLFREESSWSTPPNHTGYTNLEFVGSFLKSGRNYYFLGNVSADNEKNFGTVNFHAIVTSDNAQNSRSSDLLYGLAIGIPVTLAIILMVTGVLILRWGFKSGYLRHVPLAYKHFTNPRRGKAGVELQDANGRYAGDQTEVHI